MGEARRRGTQEVRRLLAKPRAHDSGELKFYQLPIGYQSALMTIASAIQRCQKKDA